MRMELKMLIAAALSLTTGIAFASPLFVSDMFVVPLRTTPQGPKPDVTINLVYANFTVQPTDPNMTLPEWYSPANYGDPLTLSFCMVLNVTNHSNETAFINMFYMCAANGTVEGSSLFTRTSDVRTVEGVWLDGQWLNRTWVPLVQLPNNASVGGYWKEGVDINETFSYGKLNSTSIRIKGVWVDVTSCVIVPGQVTEDSFTKRAVMTQLIASGELRFERFPSSHASVDSMDYMQTVRLQAGGAGDFDNRWAANQSRLIMLNGTRLSFDERVRYLNSSRTLVLLQADTKFADTFVNGTLVDTSLLTRDIRQISLESISNGHYAYNASLGENPVFEIDQWGVEVFIKPGS